MDPKEDEKEGEEECEHSFLLKDDIGSVCRICGVVNRSIETIIEYQYSKVSSLFLSSIDHFLFYFSIMKLVRPKFIMIISECNCLKVDK